MGAQATIASGTVERPAHVPPELEVDFDFRFPQGNTGDVHLGWRRLLDGPDIVWTPHNGGHWILTRGEDIKALIQDSDHMSSESIAIPYFPANQRPINLDPPDQAPYRRLIMPRFVPKEIERVGGDVRKLAREIIEEIAPRGECEFMADFGQVLPIVVFMKIMGLPQEDRFRLLPYVEAAVRGSKEEHDEAHVQMAAYFHERIGGGGYAPGGLTERIVTADINGAPITPEDVMSVCMLLLFGGLDTVASTLGFIARFLATHPEHRRELVERIDDPAFVRNAVEELIRRHGVPNVGRVVREDWTYKGVPFRAREMVLFPILMGGLDDRFVDDPLRVDFSRRFPIPHTGFGFGAHTCPGAVLARREIQIFLEEWLPRIPDFEIVGTPRIASGPVNGVQELHLRWNPAGTSG
ncbi:MULTISPECIES: cytochrome P450 [unclassified Sphingobium]|uniref:cytochrome P450 n=1 Tax=unclassified Sphingobium TaxID=2611147 RepID=UPI000D17DDBF|nr:MULTISPECIES: cytochrome P450 [unclassified Sphingobium]MBG6120056.1 cytochrome P450 [Sphingobium sp. JAI105]PSO12890.1 cytochrome P450 [Sphingobium sp. AEW4]TWD05743.1 cytochrome P450 [Sphingobium sp. AEW010]TWD23296.1 cytochrome P450 [Sphingobium sp. AEW013]TWD25156.1 cytochrome P450 [Sphingobium sp. AEW001]